MESVENKRKTYLDILKILSCFAVIVMHLSTNLNTKFINWSINKSFNIIGNFAVPIFVMTSGSLLLNPAKKISVKDIFLKYIPRLIISLMLVNFIINLISGILDNNLSFSMLFSSLYNIFLFKVPVPYWYIYMLIGLYLITPILKEWINKSSLRNIEYFLALFISYRIIIYTILNIPTIEFLEKFKDIYYSIQLPLVTGYCGYFILGYYLSIKDFSKIKNAVLLLALLIMLIFTIGLELLFGMLSTNYVASQTIFMDVFSINIFCISVILFILAKNSIKQYSSIISKISSKTYGIYLFHVLGLQLLARFDINRDFPIIYIPLFATLIFIFSYFLTSIIQNIPYINKYFK